MTPARKFALLSATGALALSTLLTTSASSTAAGPVGTWAAKITFQNGRIEHALFSLRPDGSLTHSDGKRAGLGSWRATATGGFRFTLRHYDIGTDGKFAFEVRAKQEGRLTAPDAFTTTGSGTTYDVDGNVLGQITNRVDAKRYTLDGDW